ncbi:hypothetical protein E5676_scaffold45G001390 [Cucumis melo var. makuwa]|uniref:Transmembrane protein n=2 Tax=Cucumis melo TaxID=3656 RepID=A0A5D3CUF1_CUCMM|nr:hypothetical protein E5676_scaffold45G001390 [Cucumis melo var. makuwa]
MAQKEGTAVSCKGLPKLFTFLFIFFLVITVPGSSAATKFLKQRCRRVENWVAGNKLSRKGRINDGSNDRSMHGDYEDTTNMSPIHHN